MPLEDYLLPGEDIRFHSGQSVRYGGNLYELLVTNKRILLYARRGLVFKSDDVVSIKLEELQGVKYKERGVIGKTGILEVQAKTLFQFEGNPAEMKTLYQQILQFI
jgi:hypothetical protein